MKKKLIGLVVCAGFAGMASAQHLKAAAVPAAAKSSFEKQYPHTEAKWEKEHGNYEVNFKKDGNQMSVVIDAKGMILETETDIAINLLPENVSSYLKTHYKGAKVKEAAKIVKADGSIMYEGEVNGKDVMFDSNGKFLKEAKD